MEFPLTSNDNKYYSDSQSNTNTKEIDTTKHRLGELIFALEKNIREQQTILENMKQLYYYG